MLSAEDSELLCKVGPGTAGGKLMREYWIPALLTSELEKPDGNPLRVRLLGENLIAFRASSGRVGLIQNACPHRRASLYYGRNEQDGLRCVYHGWKFDVTGRCTDMPLEPPENNFKDKIRVTAYPTAERCGVIWAYMGLRTTPPPLPEFEANLRPDTTIQMAMRECNWLQGLEGDIDTGHVALLHLGGVKLQDTRPGTFTYYAVREPAPLQGGRHRVRHVIRRLPTGRGGHPLLAHREFSVPVLYNGAGGRTRGEGRAALSCAAR